LLILDEFLHNGAQLTPSFKIIDFTLGHDGLSLLFVNLDGACDDRLDELHLVKQDLVVFLQLGQHELLTNII
jgi:hypothetical protein